MTKEPLGNVVFSKEDLLQSYPFFLEWLSGAFLSWLFMVSSYVVYCVGEEEAAGGG